MKKFSIPVINIQKFDAEGTISTSGCWVEAQACINCYASAAECPGDYSCSGLNCPNLQAIYDSYGDDDDDP